MANSRPDSNRNPLDIIGFFDDVTSGIGDWIANGSPSSDSIPGVVQQRYRDACDSWSNGLGWTTALNAPARATMSNICGPWLSSQGSGDPGASAPFSGGQCLCSRYQIDVEFTWTTDAGDPGLNTFRRRVTGPIQAIDARYSGSRFNPFVIDITANAIGSVTSYPSCNPEGTTESETIGPTGSTLRESEVDSIEANVIVTVFPGDADNCGNPAPAPEPNPNPRPDPGLDPEDEPFERAPGQPLVPMPPITDPFGDPVQLPNFPLPRIDGPSLFPEDEPPPSAEPGEPGTPETVAGDEEAEGEADDDETLTGVLVEVDSAPGFARTVQNVSTPTYIGACYVYLGWEGQLDLQPEGQFLVDGQFFAAVPGMTHWRVRSAVGYTLTITPYYAPKE